MTKTLRAFLVQLLSYILHLLIFQSVEKNTVKKLILGITFFATSLLSLNSQAVTIDFSSIPTGEYTVLDFGDAVLTYTGGTDGLFEVQNSGTPGIPIEGNALRSFNLNPGSEPFRLDFSETVGSFSIGVGDFGADEDNTYLQAFAADDVLLASDYYLNPALIFGGGTLSVAAKDIKYVLFWDDNPQAGFVWWDNISYTGTVVPVPASLWLFSSGLLSLYGIARRKKCATINT